MPNYKASSKLIKLDYHEAATTEGDYTFTKSLSNDDYSMVIIVIDGESTAQLALEMILNGIATQNYSNGCNFTGAANNAVAFSNETQLTFASTTLISGATQFRVAIEIMFNDLTGQDISAFSKASTPSNTQLEIFAHFVVGSAPSFESVKIQTSTSTWLAGTKISIYGLKR